MHTVKPEDLTPEFVRDAVNFAASLGWRDAQFVELALRAIARYPGRFEPTDPDTECLEVDTDGMSDEEAERIEDDHQEGLRLWCRDRFCKGVRENVCPHVRKEVRDKFCVIATALKTLDPDGAQKWGQRAEANRRADTERHLRARGRRASNTHRRRQPRRKSIR